MTSPNLSPSFLWERTVTDRQRDTLHQFPRGSRVKLSEAGKIKGLSRNRADKGIIEDVTRYGTLKVKRNNRKAIEYLTEFWELDQ